MKVVPILLHMLSLLSASLASPAREQIFKVDDTDLPPTNPFHLANWLDGTKKAVLKGKQNLEKWYHDRRDFIKQNELLYELLSLPSFDQHKLRITEPELCNTSVKQYSRYLDISDNKHLFFWFFESRSSPSTDPLILWINGGPGCSSSLGLFFELSPCSIANKGKNTTFNRHSWTSAANIIFLDQPVDVGFSYADGHTTVDTSLVVGKDVYVFLQLFLLRFPEYAAQPFHVSGESYAGTYVVQCLIFIEFPKNTYYTYYSYVQWGSAADYACNGPFPVFSNPEGPECTVLQAKVAACQRMLKWCYSSDTHLSCVTRPLMQTGLNPYDVHKKCNSLVEGLCYQEILHIATRLNDPKVKVALGVDPRRNFAMCNNDVTLRFMVQGDGVHNSAKLLSKLVDDSVQLLIYAGNADMTYCNYMGNERWLEGLESSFQNEFLAAEPELWVTLDPFQFAGTVRRAGGSGGSTAANITFITVWEAGHMVPFDQPEAALDLFEHWMSNTPIVTRAKGF
ncbi:Carboxypeptidase [Mycena venus]|uniref:Carboxypeptidase n=1 Tax=Mycena venus TaxID=2733690 RepID=A0A8H6X7W4_9AGAR|nr:Carboxypeptidase [Mycena venus]